MLQCRKCGQRWRTRVSAPLLPHCPHCGSTDAKRIHKHEDKS